MKLKIKIIKKIFIGAALSLMVFSFANAAVEQMEVRIAQPINDKNKVILNWDKVGSADYYKVFVDGTMPDDGKITNISQTSYTHTLKDINTKYQFTVQAYKGTDIIAKGSIPYDPTVGSGTTPTAPSTSTKITIGAPFPGEDPSASLIDHIFYVYKWAAVIGSLIAVFMILFAAFKYTTSAGNSEALQDAKDTIVGALIGLALIIISYLFLDLLGVGVNLK